MATRALCRITYVDRRTVSYRVTPKIQLDFERFYHKGLGTLETSGEITGGYQLAYEVQKAHKEEMPGGVMPNFEDWISSVEAMETDTEEIVPFDPAASAATSSNSHSQVESLPVNS